MNILVTGSKSGLGFAIAQALRIDGHIVYDYDVAVGDDVRNIDEKDYQFGYIDALINCAGVNRIDMLENHSEDDWDLVMDTNAKGIFVMTRAFLRDLIHSAALGRGGVIINITSDAAWKPMTSSIAYNASKAAAHMMTLQMARELTKRHGITVFGIAPNKLKNTGMSEYIDKRVPIVRGWSKEQADKYQAAGHLIGEETPPHVIADYIAFTLSARERYKYLSGCIIPFGGE